MAPKPVLLCIHSDPAQLQVLQENGYELLVAGNGHVGLQLFGSQPVDAIVLEYRLRPQDASVIASEIRQLKPDVPIVMLAEPEELPASSRHMADVVISKSAPPHFVWAAVHFALSTKRGVNFRTRSAVTRGAGSARKSRKSSRRPKTSDNRSAGCYEQIA